MTSPTDDQLERLRTVEQADVYKNGVRAATLSRTASGVEFRYVADWVDGDDPPVATTLPVRKEPVLRPAGALPSYERELAQSVVDTVCGQVGVVSSSLDIEIFEDADRVAQAAVGADGGWLRTRAGDWREEDGRSVIAVDRGIVQSPRRLVATIAHELCHQRLIGEGRVAADRPDGEELTDLATVCFGLGIFTANAA